MADSFSERLKLLRKKKDLSMRTLSEETGVPISTLSYLESGGRKGGRIRVDTAKRLAIALGVTLDYLCGMHEEGLP